MNDMPYTTNLIKTGLNVLPYGDKVAKKLLVESADAGTSKRSKRDLKAQKATAKRIQEAVQKGEIDPSFEKIAKNMKAEAQSKLAEIEYSKGQSQLYPLYQAAKLGPLSSMIPGAGIVSATATTATRLGTAQGLQQYVQEAPSYKDSALKIAQTVTPMIISATSTLWMPYVTPWLTPTAVGIAAIGTIATVTALDGITYLRGKK